MRYIHMYLPRVKSGHLHYFHISNDICDSAALFNDKNDMEEPLRWPSRATFNP
jgi:hypothetical protein